MAINRGVLGTQTGSMGGITASNWKGKNVYKQKVPARNSSNSPAQQRQRAIFAALARISGTLGPAIRIGYRMAATDKTEQNVFMVANFTAVAWDGTTATVDYSLLNVSNGIVGTVEALDVTYRAGTNDYNVTWADNSNGADALPGDAACIILVNKITGKAFISTTFDEAFRSSGGLEIGATSVVGNVPANIRGIVFFKRANGTATGPSSNVQAHA